MPEEYAKEEDLENQKRPCELCLNEVLRLTSYDTGEETLELCDTCLKETEENLK
jgi:CRISPR/Cas system-associated protein Cas10 (large subunit of type III CRISPR-Cas system)